MTLRNQHVNYEGCWCLFHYKVWTIPLALAFNPTSAGVQRMALGYESWLNPWIQEISHMPDDQMNKLSDQLPTYTCYVQSANYIYVHTTRQ